ncbi:acyltransferase family protein [Nocardioides marmoribigeumensis]|uniref:Fucose 4-O-acetylase-like acetyltransferase n=1 Tax=Nocardioides marmoribigeumensis TaxID=433649 RepID=A0ABU2BWB8_9ACTN|nr:acyltransferase family protein [Nocardioides marmoribigeumensis]MDR7362928.1 fucose 4-O-acetylase-like acetyltransferase [Nocardioides marmoribigeumensis]
MQSDAVTLERRTASAPTRESQAAATPGRKERDPFLDNSKFLFVALVVVGHAWTLAASVGLLYSWLYLWHVPAFVLVTGYLSRSFRFSRRHLHRLAVTVVFPYALFEGLFALLRIYVGGERLELLWLNPHWPMWYLSVLFLWRMATPLLTRVPHVVLLSFAVSLAGGFLSVAYLDGNRAMGLLPFFVLGLTARPEQVQRLREGTFRRPGLLVLLAGVGMAWLVESRLTTEWLYYRTPYAELDALGLQGVALRAMFLATGLLMSLAVLSWVPNRRTWYSRLGAASLVVYLFHGFVVEGLAIAGMNGWSEDHAWQSVVLTTAGGFALATALAWRPVSTRLDKVVTPPPLLP